MTDKKQQQPKREWRSPFQPMPAPAPRGVIGLAAKLAGFLIRRAEKQGNRKMTDIVLTKANDRRWGANRIELVGAESRRFPGAKYAHWDDLKGASAKARALLAQADGELHAVEHDEHLSGAGRSAKAKEIVRKHLPKLAELDNRPSSVTRRMEFLEEKAAKKMKDARTPFGAEIRAHVKAAKDPVLAAMQLKDDPAALIALIEGPPVLSGLTKEQQDRLHREFLNHHCDFAGKEISEIEYCMAVNKRASRAAVVMLTERVGLAENGIDELKRVG